MILVCRDSFFPSCLLKVSLTPHPSSSLDDLICSCSCPHLYLLLFSSVPFPVLIFTRCCSHLYPFLFSSLPVPVLICTLSCSHLYLSLFSSVPVPVLICTCSSLYPFLISSVPVPVIIYGTRNRSAGWSRSCSSHILWTSRKVRRNPNNLDLYHIIEYLPSFGPEYVYFFLLFFFNLFPPGFD